MASPSSSSSSASQDSIDVFIATLDLSAIGALALTVRRSGSSDAKDRTLQKPVSLPLDLLCTVASPPKKGSYNVVYELRFSDGVRWVIRIPTEEWNEVRARSMRFDVLAQQYILSNTSLPIPHIHAHALETNNELGHPYMITDFARGTRLVDVWNEPSWWTGERRKERLFASLAGYMVELASLEFDKIGRLDRVGPDGPYFVGPFPSHLALIESLSGPQADSELGPFDNLHAYLGTLLTKRRENGDSPMLAWLSILLSGLPEARYDSAPFVLEHPDYDSQNVFIDDKTGEVSDFIDWDGVAVVPRQLGALKYPSWLTVDWDLIMYPSYQQHQVDFDTEADLHMYRTMYTDAVGAISQEQAEVTRNSHIVSSLACAVTAEFTTAQIADHLGKFVFGSSRLMFELLEGIEHASWFNTGSKEVAQVKEWDKYDEADGGGHRDDGPEDHGNHADIGRGDDGSNPTSL